MKKWFFPLFFLISLFSEELFYGFLSVRDMQIESGMLQKLYIPIAIISYFILIRDFCHNKFKDRIIRFCLFLVLIIIMMYITSLIYETENSNHISSILYFGSICVACSVVGMHLATNLCFAKIDKLLPLFLFPIGLIVGSFGLITAAKGMIARGDESALDYQILSYYMAEVFIYSGYYLFFSSQISTRTHRLLKYPLYALMLFSAMVSVASGGRGGFVFLIVAAIFMLYLLYKRGNMSKKKVVMVLFFSVSTFVIMSIFFNLGDTEGLSRITNTLTEDEVRSELYKTAVKSFEDSMIIGHGLGSVWWEVGYYSHNMLLDILVEGGIIGALIVFFSLYNTAMIFYKDSRYYSGLIFLLFVMSEVMVHTLFSGYWLNSHRLWLLLGFAFVFFKSKEKKKMKLNGV